MNICNPRLHTQMECDTKIQNLVIDLQRKTKIRVKVAPSLCLTSQICFHYLVWSTLIHTGGQGQSLNIWFHHQLTFPRTTCRSRPPVPRTGMRENLKTPCRSLARSAPVLGCYHPDLPKSELKGHQKECACLWIKTQGSLGTAVGQKEEDWAAQALGFGMGSKSSRA